jgi:hypothetical protein
MASILYKTRALRRSVSSSAIERGGTFPFFTVPNLEVDAYGTRHEAKFETVVFAPIIQHDQLEEYFAFANEERGWLEKSKVIYDKLEPGQNRSS